MSVESELFYWLLCDRCGVKSTEGSDYVAWAQVSGAVDEASDSDWLITDDEHHYCPDCTTWDEELDERINQPPLAEPAVSS